MATEQDVHGTGDARVPQGERQSWLLLGVFAAVLACASAIPVSAALRGILRFGAVTIGPAQRTDVPLLVLGGPVKIEGYSADPVIVAGGAILVDGQANDDLIAVQGNILINPKATVADNAIAIGGGVYRAPGSSVGGTVFGRPLVGPSSELGSSVGLVSFVVARLRLAGLMITALLLLGFGVCAVLPWPALVTTATARRCRVRSAALGIGTLLWAPLVVAPLAVSLVGLPLALLLVLGLGGLWLIGIVSSAARLGHRVLNLGGRPHSLLSATLTGLICLGLLPVLPVLGAVALLLAGCVGLGAALVAVWDREVGSDLASTQALAAFTLSDS